MVLPTNVRCVAMAAALAWSAAAQHLSDGQQLRALGRYSEAREVFSGLLRDAKKSGADKYTIVSILDNLGRDENCLGNLGEAENVFNRALSLLAADDPAVFPVKTHLAELYMLEQRPAEAEPLLRQAAAGYRSELQLDAVELGVTLNDLAVASAMQRKLRESETLLRQALALLETQLGPEHPLLASSLSPLATMLVADHRYEEAVAPAERAWHILQARSQQIASPDMASMMDVLSQVYAHTGRMADAESYGRQATALAEQVYGSKHPLFARYLARYADVLNQANHKKQAKELMKQAHAILAQGVEHGGGYTVSVNALH